MVGLDIMAEAFTTTRTDTGHRVVQEVCLVVAEAVTEVVVIAQTSSGKVQEGMMIENLNDPGISLPFGDRGIPFFLLSPSFDRASSDVFDRFSWTIGFVQVCASLFLCLILCSCCVRKYILHSGGSPFGI